MQNYDYLEKFLDKIEEIIVSILSEAKKGLKMGHDCKWREILKGRGYLLVVKFTLSKDKMGGGVVAGLTLKWATKIKETTKKYDI